MATLKSVPQPASLVPAEPIGVQPGGFGPCVRLELLWGRVRRALLRRLRRGYVARMAALRQGDCPGCSHDIVDPRDLKFYRNVCGFWFREEDDPFRQRDHLGFARYGWAELVCFSAVFLALILTFAHFAYWTHPAFWLPVGPLAVLWLFVISFFRDPPRRLPDDPRALVSPADGTVTHIGEVEDPDFPGGRAFRIVIFLSVFNVHVNRVPRTGRVVGLRYFRGAFRDARLAECDQVNEQMWVDLEESNGRRLRLKQISGAIARRICCRLRSGEEVRVGDRFGMIKFGSRTDVLLPTGEAWEVQVRVGDKVHGGKTVLLRVP